MIGSTIFLVAWTDERWLASVLFVFIFHGLTGNVQERILWRSYFHPESIAVILGGLFYPVSKLVLADTFDLIMATGGFF